VPVLVPAVAAAGTLTPRRTWSRGRGVRRAGPAAAGGGADGGVVDGGDATLVVVVAAAAAADPAHRAQRPSAPSQPDSCPFPAFSAGGQQPFRA
jgi:hypothetical protein